jgi:ketosteroid isomerase-like protein
VSEQPPPMASTGVEAGAEALVAAFGEAWADHDLDRVMAMLSDDCLFDATGPAPDGTPLRGHAAIRQAWQPIFDDRDSRFEVEETFGAGDRVVQRWRYRWATGHVRGVDLFAVQDGRITEKRSYVKG